MLIAKRSFYELFIRVHIALSLVAVFGLHQHIRLKNGRKALIGGAICFLVSAAFRLLRLCYRSPVRLIQANQTARKSQPAFAPTAPHHGHVDPNQKITPRNQYSEGQIIFAEEKREQYRSGNILQDLEARRDKSNLRITRIRIKLTRPWTILPGHYIQLCIPKLGFWSMLQTHPFMVAWWEEQQDGVSIDILIERKGGFTSRLLEFACTRSSASFPVLIDGPYGLPHRVEKYGTVWFFADDIGISAILPYVKQLIHSSHNNSCVTTKIILIWRYTNKGVWAKFQPEREN